MFDFNTNEGYFLHLLRCSLNGVCPDEPPEDINFDVIYEISLRHDVENLVFVSVDMLKNKPDEILYDRWRQRYYVRQRQCLYQDMALEELVETFTSKGIDCMPLKGSVIKNYYPNPDLRCMGDIDFLVREQNRDTVREIMHTLGYRDDILDDGQVDGFARSELVYVEIHYDFSAEIHIYHDVFTIDWDKLLPDEKKHLYKMTPEDLYFFNIGHYVKNMHTKGMGLRSVLDSYVMWKVLTDDEKQNISKKLEDIDLLKFNSKILAIADLWFGNADNNPELDLLEEYLISEKTYGNDDATKIVDVLYSYKNKSKFAFFINRIFPKPDELYYRFNKKKKNFLILPYFWIKRIVLQLAGRKKNWQSVKSQVDNFDSVNKADLDYERKVRQDFGLL